MEKQQRCGCVSVTNQVLTYHWIEWQIWTWKSIEKTLPTIFIFFCGIYFIGHIYNDVSWESCTTHNHSRINHKNHLNITRTKNSFSNEPFERSIFIQTFSSEVDKHASHVTGNISYPNNILVGEVDEHVFNDGKEIKENTISRTFWFFLLVLYNEIIKFI